MAKMHFSLPDKILAWLEGKAAQRGMRRSEFLTHLLLKVIEQEENSGVGKK
jgi:metal-responsive CopG/Arc/MetJ family transcriptional regulator